MNNKKVEKVEDLRVIQLKAENVKRLVAIDIRPDSDLVVVGGNNSQGKTSVLSSILMGLTGKKSYGEQPVRAGQDSASIIIDLGKYKITKRLNPDGSGSLKVVGSDGTVYTSPQKLLDSLSSSLTFDPLSFLRASKQRQTETLKRLVGLDFTSLDDERDDIYAARTIINQIGKNKKAELDALTMHDDAPDAEIAVSQLIKQKDGIDKKNLEVDAANLELSTLQDKYLTVAEQLKALKTSIVDAKTKCNSHQPVDVGSINAAIATVETDNKKFRDNETYQRLSFELTEKRIESQQASTQIKALDEKKRVALKQARFPLSGLSFGENGVIYNDIPLEQCSSSEQLRVSVSMGFALNPELKVMLIQDGSLLDDNGLEMISQMAEEAGSQVWLEKVGTGEECSVIIEDGRVI